MATSNRDKMRQSSIVDGAITGNDKAANVHGTVIDEVLGERGGRRRGKGSNAGTAVTRGGRCGDDGGVGG